MNSSSFPVTNFRHGLALCRFRNRQRDRSQRRDRALQHQSLTADLLSGMQPVIFLSTRACVCLVPLFVLLAWSAPAYGAETVRDGHLQQVTCTRYASFWHGQTLSVFQAQSEPAVVLDQARLCETRPDGSIRCAYEQLGEHRILQPSFGRPAFCVSFKQDSVICQRKLELQAEAAPVSNCSASLPNQYLAIFCWSDCTSLACHNCLDHDSITFAAVLASCLYCGKS